MTLAGWLYDKEARRERDLPSTLSWPGQRGLIPAVDGMLMHASDGRLDMSQARYAGRPHHVLPELTKKLPATAHGSHAGLSAGLASAIKKATAGGAALASQPSAPPSCTGAHCFRLTFLILAGVCLLGSALNGWLSLRTKSFYRELWQERSREEQRR